MLDIRVHLWDSLADRPLLDVVRIRLFDKGQYGKLNSADKPILLLVLNDSRDETQSGIKWECLKEKPEMVSVRLVEGNGVFFSLNRSLNLFLTD